MFAEAEGSDKYESANVVESVGETPTTFQSAKESSDAFKWKEACDSDMALLHTNMT